MQQPKLAVQLINIGWAGRDHSLRQDRQGSATISLGTDQLISWGGGGEGGGRICKKKKIAEPQKGITKICTRNIVKNIFAKQNNKEKINCTAMYVTKSMTLNLRRNNKLVNTLNATDDWTVETNRRWI